ncbi:hypothetical protein QFC19_007333 [Naganishia cerealis]|uniref:Uncharacterized protein n=1 Tax=Naganishia cerealis TaxID=610337 RepID=A0ACC2VC06_9TREE|nr:hypothetical protein QFC19_007333 [Naganishia cerealis]
MLTPSATCSYSEHDGLKKDGTPDKRVSSEHGFGGSGKPPPSLALARWIRAYLPLSVCLRGVDGPDPHVEGAKGGKATGTPQEDQ